MWESSRALSSRLKSILPYLALPAFGQVVDARPASEPVVYRKGELSKGAIDRGWPHQVAIAARLCTGDQYMTKHFFCRDLSLCPRGHSFWRDKEDFNVYCFAEREHAEKFQQRFGGTIYDPKTRPKW